MLTIEILQMAKSCGMLDVAVGQIEMLCKLVADAEREKCAKVCDELAMEWQNAAWSRSAVEAHAIRGVAESIRARSLALNTQSA